jgi:hypothetical protein
MVGYSAARFLADWGFERHTVKAVLQRTVQYKASAQSASAFGMRNYSLRFWSDKEHPGMLAKYS